MMLFSIMYFIPFVNSASEIVPSDHHFARSLTQPGMEIFSGTGFDFGDVSSFPNTYNQIMPDLTLSFRVPETKMSFFCDVIFRSTTLYERAETLIPDFTYCG